MALLIPFLCCGCGSGDAEIEPESVTAGAEAAPTEEPTAAAPRWPRPTPPVLYRTVAVESPAVVRGTVTAATSGRGVFFDVPATESCATEPTVFAAGPLTSAVLRLEGISSGRPMDPLDASVKLAGCAVTPPVQLAVLGSRVIFSSGDSAEHAPRLIRWDGYQDLGSATTPADGSPVERRLRVPGLVHIRCDTHPASRGWLWVMDHPYHALSHADGTFRIEDVPPGAYTLRAWHEGFEPQQLDIEIPPQGELLLDIVMNKAG